MPQPPDHIPLHRLWMFATLQNDMPMREHLHLLDCEDCQTALRVCMTSENFGTALRELRPDSSVEEELSALRLGVPVTEETSEGENEDAILQAIVNLFKLAATGGSVSQKGGPVSRNDYRVRATQALGLFLPHREARTGLVMLMSAADIPAEIQNAATELLNRETP